MKVCHLTTAHRPGDVRIYHKECQSLVKGGYDVILIAPKDDSFKPESIKYIPLKKRNNRLSRLFFSPVELFFKTFKTKAKLFHFHDPELIPIGVMLKLFGKKVIYDAHENYSGQILAKHWLGNKFIRKSISLIFRFFEKVSSLFFNGIITVTPEIARLFQEKKTTVISNYPILSVIDDYKPDKKLNEKPVIIFSGGIDRMRGIREIIQAMDGLDKDAELRLMGPWESDEFKEECKTLQGWTKVVDMGVIPFGEHYKYMKMADIGIINYYPLPNHVDALPNKPFEYMACYLPLIMSNFDKWKDYFNDVALFVDPMNASEISAAVNKYLDNPEEMKSTGSRANEIVMKNYSWESEQKKLLAFYKNVLKV